jgi:hypothetical protein
MKLISVRPAGEEATICGVDEIMQEGYVTLCGWQLWNEGNFIIGDEFMGKYTKITCPNCKKVLAYFQQIFKEAKKVNL